MNTKIKGSGGSKKLIDLYFDKKKDSKNKVIISPSILSADFANLERDIRKVENDANWIHFDVMDGMFVPNISFGIPVLKAVREVTSLPLDVHLMIENPDRYIDSFAEAGADLIVVHQETCTHIHRVIQHIRSCGKNAGVALNPGTPISTLFEILPFVDLVLLMTVNPGFGGQKYIPTMTKKIKMLRKVMDEEKINSHIQVDGGIGESNIKEVFDAGANSIVMGSSVYGTKDPGKTIREMRKCLG